MPIVNVSKEFIKTLELIIKQRKSLGSKVLQLKQDLSTLGFSPMLFSRYNIKPLGDSYYRVKFIPYRIIIRIDPETGVIFLETIFKRKGTSDYKSYQ